VLETIRVALVNDYESVLEGLRELLRPYDPEIRVVELDVEGNPQSAVDVTLFDTYGEVQELRHRVRGLTADATNGAIVVFSFSDDAALAGTFLRAGAQGFISKALPAEQIVNSIRAAARGEHVMMGKHHHMPRCQPSSCGPGVMPVSWNGKANCWRSSRLV
jgi:two-component system, NarL family, response regulator LiaR